MRFDKRVKQFFPVVLAMSIALIAYLQAWGLTRLFAAHLGVDGISAAYAWPKESAAIVPPAERKPDASAILARNPFDSITGALNEHAPTGAHDAPRGLAENPYEDPICETLTVMLITTADDPRWSFAAISVGRERARLRRVGDEIGERIVHAIAWDRVWLMQGITRCQLPLDREIQARQPKEVPSNTSMPHGIADRIRAVADYQYEVDREIIGLIAENQGEIFRRIRVVPTKDADGASLKLLGIKPGSLLSSLGLVNGDKLQTINGFEMGDPMVAIQAYPRLLTSDKLDVRIVRAGKPLTIAINLR